MPKILIVEDYDLLQRLYEKLAPQHGLEWTLVDTISGVKALEGEIARGGFAGVLLDNNLGRGQECFSEVAAWIRGKDPDVRIALNSADSDSREVAELSVEINAEITGKDSVKVLAFMESLGS